MIPPLPHVHSPDDGEDAPGDDKENDRTARVLSARCSSQATVYTPTRKFDA